MFQTKRMEDASGSGPCTTSLLRDNFTESWIRLPSRWKRHFLHFLGVFRPSRHLNAFGGHVKGRGGFEERLNLFALLLQGRCWWRLKVFLTSRHPAAAHSLISKLIDVSNVKDLKLGQFVFSPQDAPLARQLFVKVFLISIYSLFSIISIYLIWGIWSWDCLGRWFFSRAAVKVKRVPDAQFFCCLSNFQFIVLYRPGIN